MIWGEARRKLRKKILAALLREKTIFGGHSPGKKTQFAHSEGGAHFECTRFSDLHLLTFLYYVTLSLQQYLTDEGLTINHQGRGRGANFLEQVFFSRHPLFIFQWPTLRCSLLTYPGTSCSVHLRYTAVGTMHVHFSPCSVLAVYPARAMQPMCSLHCMYTALRSGICKSMYHPLPYYHEWIVPILRHLNFKRFS